MEHTTYHRILRVSLLVSAIALVFESGILSQSTAQLSAGTQLYLANAIGMSAAVQPTELNQYTAKLNAMEQDLAAREAALREREISVELSGGPLNNQSTTYILASILFILLVLILLNYVLYFLKVRN